jgi:hypothetical protein
MMSTQRRDPGDRPIYPLDHAFVIALRADTALDGPHLTGRIEHMASGRAVVFTGLEMLLEFMRSTATDHTPGRPD